MPPNGWRNWPGRGPPAPSSSIRRAAAATPPVLQAIAELAPRTLIYVSCDPETLARDLDLLAGCGYQTEEVQPFDMFPQTPHVEAVARLVPAGKRLHAARKGD